MRGITSQDARRSGARSMTTALLAIAVAGAIALLSLGMASPALAAEGDAGASLGAGTIAAQASSATKASAFVYKYGRYYDGQKVYKSKCWYGKKTIGDTEYKRFKSYDVEFSISWIASGGGGGMGWAAAGGGTGYNCGKGVYITDYKGPKNAKVVVPDKIGGKPVVCVSLDGVKLKSLDVSKCKHLRALSLGKPQAGGTECTIGSIKFGKNPKLTHFSLDRSVVKKKLKITPMNLRSLRISFSNPMKGFYFDSPKLRSLEFTGVTGLELNGFKYLKHLFVSNCPDCKIKLSKMPRLVKLYAHNCNLKKLDISKNKKLKIVAAQNNHFTKKTKAALKKWQKAKKGRTLEI